MGKHRGRLELTWTDKDKALLSTGDGKYDYTFTDRDDPRVREVRLLHEVDRTQAPTPEGRPDNLPKPTVDNLLITGDAMHVLDALAKTPEWSEKYLGEVKLVYIDPPFNTGQAFTHYEDSIEHSIWLTMLRDRLMQVKPLLADDGSVWVHLDDVEVHRCRSVMDEVLGADNFVAEVVWRCSDNSNNDAMQMSEDHNTLLVYSKTRIWRSRRALDPSKIRHYRNPDNDPRGPHFDGNPLNSPNPRENLKYDLTSPSGTVVSPPPNGWRWSRATMEEKIAQGEIQWRPDHSGIFRRTYLADHRGTPPSNLWADLKETGHTRQAKSELKALFPEFAASDLFDTPKPERLLQRIIRVSTDPGDLVMDCFAGSGTTAAVAHKMGRRWITSELIGDTAETFTKPRLTRVVKGDDPGGVTSTSVRVDATAEGLPDMTPDEAKEFARLLGKAVKGRDGLDDITVRALRAATKTCDEITVNWHGGGGFTHLAVGPSMYEVDEDDGDVYLSPAATNGAWSQSVAAQLRFTLTPDHPVFCGRRGSQRLAVIDGVADEVVVRVVLEHLGEKERAVVVAKVALADAESLLTELSPGSRMKKAPHDLFPMRTVR